MQCLYNLKCCAFPGLLCRRTFISRPSVSETLIRKVREVQFRGFPSSNKSAFEVNTNVAKDVVLFRYDNPKFFRVLHSFSLCQFAFWTYLAHFAFTSLKDIPPLQDENLPWWRKINLGDTKFRIGLTVASIAIGYGILGSSWLFAIRSVKYLTLRKGGQEVILVTNGLFGRSRTTTVSLDKISCEQSRHSAKAQLPLQVKGHILFYMLDMRGEFTNPKLFDYTAGLRRKF